MKLLKRGELYASCAPESLRFESTDQLSGFETSPGSRLGLGQERAIASLGFGVGVGDHGFNLFVMGPPGVGRHGIVLDFLRQRAVAQEAPADICYVNRFDQPQRPVVLVVPRGRGIQLRQDMRGLVEELRAVIPAVFENEEYRASKSAIEREIKERHDSAFESLQNSGEAEGVRLIRAPDGMMFAPMKDGRLLSPDEFKDLPLPEQQEFKRKSEAFHTRMLAFVSRISEWEKEGRERVQSLNRRLVGDAVDRVISGIIPRYSGLDSILQYLAHVRGDVVENFSDFVKTPDSQMPIPPIPMMMAMGPGAQPSPDAKGTSAFRRYEVNVLVDNSSQNGAPVIFEDNPTYQNLIGRIDHIAQFGALATDFSLMKAGSLLKANGGYLVVDAYKVLGQPFAWDALKRALMSGELRIESVGQFLNLVSTVSLEPEPLKLSVKVVLIGEQPLFQLLSRVDPEFHELFKVPVDFDEQIDRNPESEQFFAQLIGLLARSHELRPLNRQAVARLIEESSRAAGDQERLSARIETLHDLLREADYFARGESRNHVILQDVERSIEQREYRQSRVRDRLVREIHRGTISIDVSGQRVGRVNGLAVAEIGNFMFGYPAVITARARLGRGELVDIEREAKLGGPLHSKGVLILSGYLGGRYALNFPLSVAATVVFEQSYGVVEGDSASMGELLALLSAIGEVPILQSWAITGSVNQLGEAQAIGGVNEKIEGFFKVCSGRGLSGSQGVVIPRANVRHLMLKREIVEAVEAGRFRVVAIDSADEGIEILSGLSAAHVHARVEGRLRAWAEQVRTFARKLEALPGGKGEAA